LVHHYQSELEILAIYNCFSFLAVSIYYGKSVSYKLILLLLLACACGLTSPLSDCLFDFRFIYSMSGFAISLAQIEVGIAYSLWGALGTLVVTTVGIVCFGESYDKHKLICLAMIMAGVIGLNLRDTH
jgi:multidrug transporter EmrE-like cation transporter